MADSKPKAWTEAEKLGLAFQIIEHAGSIPWAELTLPEGRTKKACTVMLDRERQKYKKALAEERGVESSSKGKRSASKKRVRGDDDEEDDAVGATSKSSKKGKGNSAKAKSNKAKAEPKVESTSEDSGEEAKSEEEA